MKVCLLLSNGFDSQNVQEIIEQYQLDIKLSIIITENFDNKNLKQLSTLHPNVPFVFFNQKGQMILAKVENKDILKVACDWQSLQSRIVKAGKKSETLLKVAKLQNTMQVIDCTAGFGHDSLILASTGANVAMIEQNPLIFLLLKLEYQFMLNNPNWQKLLTRITLFHGKSETVLATLPKADVIYLDPMFPDNSYKSAVNKNMQFLHEIVSPPSLDDEQNLLQIAKNTLNKNGKILVKRPKSAPFFANCEPIDSMGNDVIRFDEYR